MPTTLLQTPPSNFWTLQRLHTHYTLSVAIALVHLLLTAARFEPAMRARLAARCGLAERVYLFNSNGKNMLLYSLYWERLYAKKIEINCCGSYDHGQSLR